MSYEQSNVGSGMAPHRKNCQCDDCTIERLRAENAALRSRLAESEARHERVMAAIRPFCEKHAPDLLAEFDASLSREQP